MLLRRVVVVDVDNERVIGLLTHLLNFGATAIAAIYKDHRQIELFLSCHRFPCLSGGVQTHCNGHNGLL